MESVIKRYFRCLHSESKDRRRALTNACMHTGLVLKVEKVWNLHTTYKWVRIGCVHSHNLNVESLHTLIGSE